MDGWNTSFLLGVAFGLIYRTTQIFLDFDLFKGSIYFFRLVIKKKSSEIALVYGHLPVINGVIEVWVL